MPRALAVARLTVPPAQEAAYLAGAAELALALRARGQHLWVFRHPTQPGTFLEFREAADENAHSSSAPTPAEARLTSVLRALATYAPGMDDLWLEVALEEGRNPIVGLE